MAIKFFRKKIASRGFTIFFAMLVGSLALSVGLAIYDLTVRELDLSSTATQSQYAIYAADTGAECALYWDFKCTLGPCIANGNAKSAFATSSQTATPLSGVVCNGQDLSTDGTPPSPYQAPPTDWTPWIVASTLSAATTTFTISFSPQPYCVTVTVEKSGSPIQTTVTAHGYNTCAVGGLTRLERVLQVTY